jgi:HEAT repeat protein
LKEKSALPTIESAFARDPSPTVRAAALSALGNFFQKGGELVLHIIRAARDPSDTVRSQVLPMIQQLSPRELQGTREQLIPLLDSSQEGIRGPVAELLARLYTPDWHLLADQLLGTEKQSRILGLIETLGNIGDEKIAPLFLQWMKHPVSAVRSTAALTAAKAGVLTKQDWTPYLEDPVETVRLAAIRGLGNQLDGAVLDIFAGHLEDPSTQIRREIAILLGKKKLTGDERPKEILRRLSRDEHLEVRLVSFVSLFRLGMTGLAEEVRMILPNFEREERDAILEYLKREGIFVELMGMIQHAREVSLRKEAILLLAALDLTHYVHELLPSLQDPASVVRLAAIEALGQVEDLNVQQAVGALSQDPVEEVRQAVKRRKLRTVK